MSKPISPWMDDELNILQEVARQFIAEEMVPHIDRWTEQGMVDREMWNNVGGMGFLCASIPEEYGGAGGTFAHDWVLAKELTIAGLGGFSNSVHTTIVAHYFLSCGTEEQKKKWLPKMATGEMVGAVAMTEPGAGSDLQAIKTTANREGDHYVINGSKTFITNGYHADLIVVVAKTDPTKGGRGISLIAVETKDLEGFSRGKPLKKLGGNISDTAELFFDNVRVPVENLLGNEEGKGFYQLMQNLPAERMDIALTSVAHMEHAIELATEYAKERQVFGRPLIEFQNTRFKLAEAKTVATVARAFIDQCVIKAVDGTLDPETAAMAKWWATEQQGKVIDECLQLFGGYGFMLEYPIARMYAEARVTRILGGTTEILKEVVARKL